MAKDTTAAPTPTTTGPSRRTQLFRVLGAVVLVAAILFGLYWLLIGSHYESTDNAYVSADTATITPQISGQVVAADVSETQFVKAGQILVRLDDTDAKVALAEAQAQLGQAERRVRGYFANGQALDGQIAARAADISRAEAQIVSAQSDLDRARTELKRRQDLAASGAVSGDELTLAQNQFHIAESALTQARAGRAQALANRTAADGARDVNAALITGAGVDQNPEVLAARAKRDAAQLDLDRTVLRAPIDGVVAKKQVALGQRVPVGADLMTIVPIASAYVYANFKEVQLRRVRLGQPATLTSDFYGGGVKFRGQVVGLAGGTGAAFAVIPAENATGNWIKVVQRLPVRIAINPEDLRRHPLRVGLSTNVDVDVSHP